jgi:tetratricopeptide (TPR) repeat protein
MYKGASTSDGLLFIEKVDQNQPHTLRAKKEGFPARVVQVPPNTPEVSIQLLPDPVLVLLKSLKQHAARGQLSDAFGEYARLVSGSPDQPELPRLLETMLQSLQSRSLNLLKTVGPYGLAVELKEAEELKSLYEQARRWRPEDETIDEFARYWGLKYVQTRADHSASVLEREGLRAQARSVLSEFSGHDLRNMHLLLDLGWAWWKLDDKTAAQRYFNKAQELRPDWAYIHFALGALALNAAERELVKSAKTFKYGQAIDSFTKAIEVKQNFSQAYALRSIAYGTLNRHEEAVASGLQAITLAPQSAHAHFALGFAYFQKGKSGYRDALNEYTRALSLGESELDEAAKTTIQQRLVIINKALK